MKFNWKVRFSFVLKSQTKSVFIYTFIYKLLTSENDIVSTCVDEMRNVQFLTGGYDVLSTGKVYLPGLLSLCHFEAAHTIRSDVKDRVNARHGFFDLWFSSRFRKISTSSSLRISTMNVLTLS
jgi:hypothetical protein